MRMSRRMGLLGGRGVPTLAELFSNMTYVTGAYRDASSMSTFRLTISNIPDSSSPYYVIFCGGPIGFEFFRVNNGTKIQLCRAGNSTCSVSSSYITSPSVYAGFIAIVRFPAYTSEVVDQVLGAVNISIKASVNNQSTSPVNWSSPAPIADALYFAGFVSNSTIYFSISLGSSILSAIFARPGSIMYLYYMTMYGNMYTLSVTGQTYAMVRCGGIYELT